MKKLIWLFVILISFCGCKKEEEESKVAVSINNASGESFKSLQVQIQGQQFNFENVSVGTTHILRVNETYRYFYVKAVTATDELVIQPIDFVGEELVKSGELNFKLKISNSNNRRILVLESY